MTGHRPIDGLSARQYEVLALSAQGLGTKEIAARLWLAPGTVKCHLKSVRQRLNAATTTHAVAKAYEQGILP